MGVAGSNPVSRSIWINHLRDSPHFSVYHAGQRVGAIHEFFSRRKLTLDLVRETQAVQKLRKLTLYLDQLMQAGQWDRELKKIEEDIQELKTQTHSRLERQISRVSKQIGAAAQGLEESQNF